ncbi:hypothetical protein SAMN05660642_01209 [Geodermatophilus siccatus]|uniref:PRC-barrel domain-containing protein n=1 Tax=Geodermatophilus siccatus TaxID=1137991 RepID=A0A1G9PGQ8_9ACTN|nr:hypothetical protein [Geodermatophilus siccatus]SDL97681.1 hypothetical protein SAMN05660642_01209 [Geodermatophilus siccatus]
MTLPDRDAARDWIGRTVLDRDGAEIGVCAALLADEATGLPEWMYAERDEGTVVVPLLDATDSGGRVQVTVTRADADRAPRFGPARELSQDQEAELYRHYGIEYSTATSDSLLPAAEPEPTGAAPTGAAPTGADAGVSEPAAPEPTEAAPIEPPPTGSAPTAAVGQLAASGDARRGRGVAAAVALLAGLAAAVVAAARLRRGSSLGSVRLLRRRPPPPRSAAQRALAGTSAVRARAVQVAAAAGPALEASSRLAQHGAAAGAQVVGRAAVDAAQRAREASTAARTYTDAAATRLTPLLTATGQAAWQAARARTDSALRATDAATLAVAAAVPRVTAGIGRAGTTVLHAVLTVGAAAEAAPEAIAETAERLEKGWRRVMGRLSLGLGFGVGYVLGARAGRARYEQIRQAAAGVMERPEVQQAVDQVRAAAPAPLQGSIDKLSGRGSARQDTSADTVDVEALVVEEVDVVVTPPPVSGTGGPVGTGTPVPDPLVPPAKSDDDPTGRP